MIPLTDSDQARVREAIGKEPPVAGAHPDLDAWSPDLLAELDLVYRRWGSILAFCYVRHVSDAAFPDVKWFLDDRGYVESVD